MSVDSGTSPAARDALKEQQAQLEWIKFREDTLGENAGDGVEPGSKLLAKMKQNPVVPIGALITTGALGYGLWNFRLGRAKQSQSMMRLRVGAQGFTIVALLVGVLWTGTAKG